jgi:hypothetical protein
MQDYIYGAASGFIQTIIGYPLDTYKTRLQNGIVSKKMPWSGIKYPLSASMFICAGSFGTYNRCKSNGLDNVESGFVSGLVMSPFVFMSDIGKVKQQTGKSLDWTTLKKQKGLTATSIRESGSFSVYFYTFNKLKETGIHPSISGGISGMASWAVTYPFDVIRNRQISSNITISEAIKKGRFFAGFWICMMRAFFVNSAGLWVYDTLKTSYG